MRFKSLLFLLLLFSIQSPQIVFGQICFPAKKIHAYFQPVIKGVTSKEEANRRADNGNYFIFIESKRAGVTLKNIWINGTTYYGHLQEVSTPVMLSRLKSNSPLIKSEDPVEMVPGTKNKVYKIIFTAPASGKSQAILALKYTSRQLVLELQYKKRQKILIADQIKQLEAAAAL